MPLTWLHVVAANDRGKDRPVHFPDHAGGARHLSANSWKTGRAGDGPARSADPAESSHRHRGDRQHHLPQAVDRLAPCQLNSLGPRRRRSCRSSRRSPRVMTPVVPSADRASPAIKAADWDATSLVDLAQPAENETTG